jgi:indole-3-glycerol phosphate synthase
MTSTVPNVLQKIADSVSLRLQERKKIVSFEEMTKKALVARKPHDFAGAFRLPQPLTKTIAEIKFTSPALGKLDEGDVNRALLIAKNYLDGGTTAISVLTEADHFQGSLDYLRAIRLFHAEALLLMKDFVLDEYQILEARVHGADCILLIVALLGQARTETLQKFALAQGLSVLVEVHDETELAEAMAIRAPLIGINNRNLKTLAVSLETSFRLIQNLKNHPPLISESGIQTATELKKLTEAGFAGFLIGSSLMREANPGATLAKLLKEANS